MKMLLEIKNLYFSYQEGKPIFEDLNLCIEEGKIIALVGESGCGKSTLLSLIYGLLDWQSGDIFLKGKKLLGPKGNLVPGEADMKWVAQNYDLMPYATVSENVGKFISNINLKEKNDRVKDLLNVVGMQDFANAQPKYLSGGQQQRVAIARALSVPQELVLLDEPFSHLDYHRKVELRESIFQYAQEKRISMIISTHEIEEIMPWVDKIVILKDGKIIQSDTPENVYKNPKNEYVARLFGEVNIFTEEEQKQWNIPESIYFPTQIEISQNGEECLLLESRFSGSYYRNKAIFQGKKIIFYTKSSLYDKVLNSVQLNFQKNNK